MTYKTDVAALRDKHALALKGLTERLTECNRLNYCWDELSAFAAFSSTVIDQLKAEHQRADKAESYARERDSENESMALSVGRLRSELDQIRDEQEPVAWIVEGDGCPTHLTSDKKYAQQYPNRTVTPLFTRPHKPVVVRKIGHIDYDGGEYG